MAVNEQEKEKQRKNRLGRNPEDGPEDLEMEMRRSRMMPLNRTENLFDAQAEKLRGGLNSAPSVFDRSAVFKTTE